MTPEHWPSFWLGVGITHVAWFVCCFVGGVTIGCWLQQVGRYYKPVMYRDYCWRCGQWWEVEVSDRIPRSHPNCPKIMNEVEQ